MYALYLIGGRSSATSADPVRDRVLGVRLAGSFGALLLTPNALTAGASGAIFGLMGAMFVLERQRGIALLAARSAG